MIHLDYRDARPIYAQIVDGLRSQILAGVLPAGERLPSVRELAGELTINPNTIQRAYRELENAGLIATVPGKGCFVCPRQAQTHIRQQTLLQTLENTAKELLSLGMTREQIIAHLQGGIQDA